MGQSSKSCTYILFLTQDVEIKHIFALWAAVSEIMADFQNCHIWPWNMAIGQNSRSGKYILFLTQGLEIELILALRPAVSETLADFQNFHIWAWIPEVAHILSFYPEGLKLSLVLLYGQRFPRYGQIFKLAVFGHKTWQVAKVPDVAHTLSFYSRESKLSSLLLYGQRFPGYGPTFIIAIFGHETWQVAKVPEVAHTPFLPQGVETELVFALRAAVSKIWANFQNCHIWIYGHETWQLAKVPEVVPRIIEVRLLLSLVAHILSFYSRGSKLSIFLL